MPRPRLVAARTRPALARTLRVLLSLAVAGIGAGVGLAIGLTWHPAATTVDALVVQAIRVAGIGACAWYALAALVSTVTLLAEGAGGTWRTGRRVLTRWGPRLVRHVAGAGAVAGVTLVALVAPSSAVVPDNLTVPLAQDAQDARGTSGGASERPTSSPQGGPEAVEDRSVRQVDDHVIEVGQHGVAPLAVAAAEPSSETVAAAEPRPIKATPSVTPAPPAPAPLVAPSDPPRAAPPVPTDLVVTIPTVNAPAAGSDGHPYTVRPGDSLWRIAAEHDRADGPGAGASWRDWYDANADVIGPDPDLIHPGTVLTSPIAGPVVPLDPTSPHE